MKLLANLIRSRFWFVGMAASLALAGCGGGSGGGTASSGALAAPSAVTVKVNADHSLSLDWSQAGKAVAYNLYCSETSPVDQATAIKSINAASPFLLVAPASGTLNCVVTAIDGFGLTETTPSPPVRIVFPPAAPSNVQATAIPGTLALNWSPVPNAQGYRVYVFDKNETAFDKALKSEGTETPSFNVTGLTPGTTYRFVVTAYLKDGDTTRESVASEIKSQTPKAAIDPLAVNATAPRPDATGVIASTLNFVSVTFNRALNPASVNNQILTVTGPSGPVGGEVTLGSNADILKFTPGSTLLANKPYTVTVHKGIKDAEGLPLAEDYVFSFTTATVTTSGGGTVEQPPQVVGVSPIDNRTNVDPALAKINVSFDKTMAVATISGDTLTVTRPDGSEVAGTVTYDQNGTTASFAPSSPFVANLRYTINVSTGVKDSAGLPIAAAVASSFTTKLPTLNVSDVAVEEGGGSASVALTLDMVSGSPVTVDFATVNDTATAPADFTAKSGSLTFAPGETSKTIVSPIVDDTIYETAEAFKVSFSNASGATLVKSQATVTINDNETLPALSVADLQVSESVGSAIVVASLNHPSAFPVSVDFATANGAATEPSDYTKSAGRITFAPGETNKAITFAISDDTTYEATETLSVSLSNASGATLGKGQATVTINDNETIPAISVADLQVSESAGSASVVVSLNYASPFPITVDFVTANGSAVAPGDYAATSGKLTFAAGETSKSIPVVIVNDTTLEASETFTVTLSNVSGATIADNSALVTIQNDDAPAAPSVSLQNGDAQVTVNWADVTGATSYNIYYAKQTGVTPANYAAFTGGTALINVSSGRTITGLTNGTDYFFVVTALAGTLESNASPQRGAQPRGPAPVQPKLNDTGIDTCSTGFTNGLACPQTGFLNQDGDFGRDAQARAGTLQKIGIGSAGFDYTKIGANGQVLANNAGQWDCVRDNVTGLLWENKQAAGSKTLRDAGFTYTWFSTTNNGGSAGTANGGVCFDATHCDTEKFAAEVNKQGLCGYSDWRLPSIVELSSLVNGRISFPGPALETALFPATKASYYWPSSPSSESSNKAWGVFFDTGDVNVDFKSNSFYVRLVRGP